LETDGVEALLFELASESRLGILHKLQNENLKMQEVARRLGVTATEAFRQLERLSSASLVQKQPDGTFAITEYGKVVLQLSSSFEFISKHKDYFSAHWTTQLPPQFVSRLGALSNADLVMDTVESLNRAERALMEAEQYGWGIAEGTIPAHMNSIMDKQDEKGVNLKFIIPEDRLPNGASPSAVVHNTEMRTLPDIPAVVVLTEKEAGICFRQLGGRVDYTGFWGNDPAFLNWIKDLFLHYWQKGKQA